MKILLILYWIFFLQPLVTAQVREIDSLKTIISLNKQDTSEVRALLAASNYFANKQIDSQIKYAEKGFHLAQKLNFKKGEADFLLFRGILAFDLGNRSQGLEYLFRSLAIFEALKDEDGIVAIHLMLQAVFREAGDYRNSLLHAEIVKKIVEPVNKKGTVVFQGLEMTPLILAEMGGTYETMGQLDSARLYTQAAIDKKLTFLGTPWSFPYEVYGKILTKEKKYGQAMQYFWTALPLAVKNGNFKDTLDIYNDIAILYKQSGQLDSAVHYAGSILHQSKLIPQFSILLLASTTLAETYKLIGNKDSTLKYIEYSSQLREQIFSRKEQIEFQNQAMTEVLRKQELIREKVKYQNNMKFYLLLIGLLVFALFALFLFRNNQNRKKAFRILSEQKEETELQREKAETTLLQLQSAQAQLIQSEKMASLGELTAGIAHEIQNPLNFVNNFSELNLELINELTDEIDRGNFPEVKKIASDIKENEAKINLHGKRADVIVKGMQQHSGVSSGQKGAADINVLADEYFRLAYSGFRSKDNSFNVIMETDFDETISEVDIISRDIGRVLLNLYNNAFYAVAEKQKLSLEGFQPTVSVRTKKVNGAVEISIADNGNGIPEKLLDKVFQPFFTTKPTGQGTGLGLSISYDIIKTHQGKINIRNIPGMGAAFIISLPINT